jgi:hypothetical protein
VDVRAGVAERLQGAALLPVQRVVAASGAVTEGTE